MATWPATLPPPHISGYSVAPREQVARTEMDGGNTRARRRTTARVDLVQVAWAFDGAQMDDFRDWWDGAADAAGGASWFSILLPLGYESADETVDARFTGPWSADWVGGGRWRVTATLEIRPSA